MINYTRRLVKLADAVSATLLAAAYGAARAAHTIQVYSQGWAARVHVKALRRDLNLRAAANVTAAKKVEDMVAYKYSQIEQMNNDIKLLKAKQITAGTAYAVASQEAVQEAESLGITL